MLSVIKGISSGLEENKIICFSRIIDLHSLKILSNVNLLSKGLNEKVGKLIPSLIILILKISLFILFS